MLADFFSDYLDLLIKFKIYPFAPLEINFVISFAWLLLSNFGKNLRRSHYPSGKSSYMQFKIISYILSFLVMFLIFLSLEFWSISLNIKPTYLFVLPSLVGIVLLEFSSLLATLFYQVDEHALPEEKEMELTTKKLSYHTAISFVSLLIFWAYMIFNSSLS